MRYIKYIYIRTFTTVLKYRLNTSILLLFVLGTNNCTIGQSYLLANENIIYSFTAENNKKMVLAKDSSNKYIIYRLGTNEKIEFEFPEKTKNSWDKFTYSFYFRGGGKQNEGLDLNYVYFVKDNFKYIIYNTYSAVDEKSKCGIKVLNTKTKNTVDIKGNINSIQGSLTDFRDNHLLKISDEIFD